MYGAEVGMKESWNFEQCVSVLTGEIELLKKISAAQKTVRQAVMNREWADFDEKQAEINHIGEEVTVLEDKRLLLFSALDNGPASSNVAFSSASVNNSNAAPGKPFYALVSSLPMEESRELTRLYRELKMETLKVKALNETFMSYLNEARTLAAAYLEAVCPARGGKLYTRKGSRVSQDLRSIVINNRF